MSAEPGRGAGGAPGEREPSGPGRETPPSGEPTGPTTGRDTERAHGRRGRGWLWALGAIVLAFVIGFGWQWLEARDARGSLERAERELEYQRLGNVLGAATVQASRGNHEPARQLASRFYSGLDERLRAEAGGSDDEVATVDTGVLRELLRARDDMITALSRANPDADERLAEAFVRFHGAAGFVDAGPGGGDGAEAPDTGTAPGTGVEGGATPPEGAGAGSAGTGSGG